MKLAAIGTTDDIIAMGLAGITQLIEIPAEKNAALLALEQVQEADAIIMSEHILALIREEPEAKKQFIITIPQPGDNTNFDRLATLAKEVLGVSIQQQENTP